MKFTPEINSLIILVPAGFIFVLATVLTGFSIILVYPILVFYIFHRYKIWQTKKRAIWGTIAILIVSLLLFTLFPLENSYYVEEYNKPYVPQQFSGIVKNVTTNFYPVNGYFNVTITTNKSEIVKISIDRIDPKNLTAVSFKNYTSNSTKINNIYVTTFSINVSSYPSGLYITNVSMENGSVWLTIWGPRMMTDNDFRNFISNLVLNLFLWEAIIIFLISEGFFLAIIFGAHLMRKGRQVINK